MGLTAGRLAMMLTIVVAAAVTVEAQRRYRNTSGPIVDRNGVPVWEVNKQMPHDLFTFVRIEYDSYGGRFGAWQTDFPDSDLNFSFRLQQLTSLKVAPEPIQMRLTDPRLFDYPFIYMLETGNLAFNPPEVEVLRKYLLNGGFLMVDDFWGGDEYENFHQEIKRVFPDREPVDLDISHPIFHTVFDLKKKPQVPSIEHGKRGEHYEWRPGPDDGSQVHYRAIFDDKGRIMVMICHNTDLGDGWEREGEDENYFHEYSEKQAYPMGINIVFYAMTH
ncbi:MAG: DUF4159 domain-containing protein [Phycisphaera sp.]|nr:DUF4159 domain-containing protein [Phycisphaera sp.]